MLPAKPRLPPLKTGEATRALVLKMSSEASSRCQQSGAAGGIQFLQHVPFPSSIASLSCRTSLGKAGMGRGRVGMIKQESSPLLPQPGFFSPKPVVRPLRGHVNADGVEHRGRLAKYMRDCQKKKSSKLIKGAENGAIVKSKHTDDYAFIVCLSIIFIIPSELQLQLQNHV